MDAGKILVAQSQGIYIVKFVGDVRLNLCSTLDKYTDEMFENEAFKTVIIDLSETQCIDSTSLGQLAKISILVSNCSRLSDVINDVWYWLGNTSLFSMALNSASKLACSAWLLSNANLCSIASSRLFTLPVSDLY